PQRTSLISTFSLHDALPISRRCQWICRRNRLRPACRENILPRTTRYRFVSNEQYKTATFFFLGTNVYRFYSQSDEYVEFPELRLDRKSTRLNSSHVSISYAV